METVYGNQRQVFEDYVASTSTFVGTRRLIEDVGSLRTNYESVWDELSQNERDQLVDENVVGPEAVLKYGTSSGPESSSASIYPKLKYPTGQKKTVVEDTSGSQGEDLDSASSGCVSIQVKEKQSFKFLPDLIRSRLRMNNQFFPRT